MYNPKISIVMPVYNGANYLKESIDSALSQTYKNIEVIVVNDGSSDNGETEKIALSYGDKIRYIPKENGGSSSALNVGIKNMTGDYFAWLSHDDIYTPDHVEKIVKRIDEKNKDNRIIICGISLIDGYGNPIPYPKKQLSGEYSAAEMMGEIRNGANINGCCILIPKNIIDNVGFFDETLIYVNDTDYWQRLMLNGYVFTCFDEPLSKIRIHQNQVSVRKAEYFDKEKVILAESGFKTLLENPKKNYDLYCIFLQHAAFSGLMKQVNAALKIQNVSLSQKCKIGYYFIKGSLVRGIKRIYRKLFFKR